MKKRLIVCFAFIVLLIGLITTSPIRAQETPTIWSDQGTATSFEDAANGDVNATAHVANVNSNNYADIIRRTLGPVEGITVSSLNSPLAKQMLKESAVNNLSNYIVAFYMTPPASTSVFVQDIGRTLGFIPTPAYAQGIGFNGLAALLPIWKAFRNIAYLLLAVVMTAVGFMVMFRKKIDPKTVVTVQNALPRIVVTLLLITFSYAIVGLIIDIMYILIGLIIGVFQSTNMFELKSPSELMGGGLFSTVFTTINLWDLPWRIMGITDTWLATGELATIGVMLGGALGLATGVGGIAFALVGVSGLLLTALISLAILLLFLRLFVFFLSTYIKIILALVFAPLQLVMGAIPGNDAFGSWMKNLIANILVFPASAAMFLLARMFFEFSNKTDRIWAPPYVGLTSGSASSIGSLVALGLLFAVPNVGKQIQEALKSKGGMSAGIEGVGGIFAQPIQMAMQGYQFWTSHETMKHFRNQAKLPGGDTTTSTAKPAKH